MPPCPLPVEGRSWPEGAGLLQAAPRASGNRIGQSGAQLVEGAGRAGGRFAPAAVDAQQAGIEFLGRGDQLADIGGKQGTVPLSVGVTVVTEFKEGAHWQPQKLSHGQAVLALLANTVSARRAPEAALKKLIPMVENAQNIKSLRGDAEEVAQLLLGGLSS